MVQATTPTYVITLPNTVDLTEIANMYFSLTSGQTTIVKTGTDCVIDGQTVSVYLTQAETLPFKAGFAQLQLNWTYANGARACSEILSVPVGNNLLKEVVD